MIANFLLFIFPLLLMAVPVLLYQKEGNAKRIRFFTALALSSNARKLVVNIVALIVILFHLVFYAVFPSDYGIMFSTILVFVLLSTKRCEKLLQTVRNNLRFQAAIFILILVSAFTPHLLSLAITMAFMLEASYIFPGKHIKKFILDHHEDEPDYEEKFLDAYFK